MAHGMAVKLNENGYSRLTLALYLLSCVDSELMLSFVEQ